MSQTKMYKAALKAALYEFGRAAKPSMTKDEKRELTVRSEAQAKLFVEDGVRDPDQIDEATLEVASKLREFPVDKVAE